MIRGFHFEDPDEGFQELGLSFPGVSVTRILVYWGCIGIMEKKMETTIMGFIGCIGV